MIEYVKGDWHELADFMSELSERGWNAGWMQNLEYDLWEAIISGQSTQYGQTGISQQDIGRLKQLSDKLEGWIYWDNQKGEQFVSLASWQEMYDDHILN